MTLKYVSSCDGWRRYELYNGDKMELYVESKLSAIKVVKMLFTNFGIKDVRIG